MTLVRVILFENMSNEASESLIKESVEYKSLFPFLHILKRLLEHIESGSSLLSLLSVDLSSE